MKLTTTSIILAACVLLWPAFTVAQVVGVVVDTSGEPVQGARVELWSEHRRLATTTTSLTGMFGFAAADTPEAHAISVSRLGYGTVTRTFRPGESEMRIGLVPVALQLEGVSVEARAPRRCPNREDPQARSLWIRTASRYSRATDSINIEALSDLIAGEVDEEELGNVRSEDMDVSGAYADGYRRHVDRRIGYGYALSGSIEPEFAAWSYMPLWSFGAPHFLDPSFGEHNTLSILARSSGTTVIVFCSRGLSRTAVAIEGTLSIGPDSSFASATWRFLAPRRREEAGGRTIFAPHPGGSVRPWLVAAQGFYWRREHGRSRVYRILRNFEAWQASPDGPVLTPRSRRQQR
jgi:hypothetical protein